MEHSLRSQTQLGGPDCKISQMSVTLQNCYVTEMLAFPRSLAVCRGGLLAWNATCWLDRFPIPSLTMRKIADHCKNPTLHEGQICELKGSLRSNEHASHAPDIRLLIVFPHLKSFGSKDVQRIWTDKIVLPSLHRHVPAGVRQYAPSSYETLRLNSQVKRVELLQNVGDTPCCFYFRSDNLEGMWEDIVGKTREVEFEMFRDAFLVAIGQWHPTFSIDKSVEGAWKRVADMWDTEMDMNHIPTKTLGIRMESQFGVGV